MNVDFQILWFDDQPVQSKQIVIKDFLKQEYELNVKYTKKKGNEDLSKEDFDHYDLIMMDYALVNSNTGVEKFKIIRNMHSYVDVAFYSTTEAELMKDIQSLDFAAEGAYFLECGNDTIFLKKLKIL